MVGYHSAAHAPVPLTPRKAIAARGRMKVSKNLESGRSSKCRRKARGSLGLQDATPVHGSSMPNRHASLQSSRAYVPCGLTFSGLMPSTACQDGGVMSCNKSNRTSGESLLCDGTLCDGTLDSRPCSLCLMASRLLHAAANYVGRLAPPQQRQRKLQSHLAAEQHLTVR